MSETRESGSAASCGSRSGSGAVHNGSVPSATTIRETGPPRLAGPPLALPRRIRRAAPGVLAWAVALALVGRLVVGYLTNQADQRLVDLDVYRTGGVSLLHGQPIYHMLTQAPQLLPFTYPPIAAVFAVPLAMMSWPAAQVVWVAFIYVPLAVTIWYAFRPLLGITPGGRPPGTPRAVTPGGRPPGTPRAVTPGGRPTGAPRTVTPGGRPPGRTGTPGDRPPGAGAPLAVTPGGRPTGIPRAVTPGGRPTGTPGICAGRYAPVAYAGLFTVCAYLFPLRDQMRFGQVDVLLVALCVADCAAVNPRWPRGALVGLATAVKLTPGVFIIYLWISGRRRAAATAAAVAVAWTLGAFMLLPRDSLYYWTNAIFDSNRLGSNTGTSNQSLRGVLLRLFLPSAAPSALWLAALIVVGVAGFAVARRVARTGGEMAGVAVTGLLAVLLSPVAWIHHLAWVVVVIGAVVGDGRDRRRLAAAAAIAVFYTVTLPWWGLSLLKVTWLPKLAGRIVQSSFGLGAIALIPVVAWAHRRGVASADTAAPGRPPTALPPGNSALPPGNSALPPGNSALPPGNSALPPGNEQKDAGQADHIGARERSTI